MDIKQWLSETAGKRVTDQEIADILRVTRKTANKRINEGLSSDDLIAVCEAIGINRTQALVELERLPHQDVLDYLQSDGELLATASPGKLSLELALSLNPSVRFVEIDELAARRSNNSAPVSDPSATDIDDGTVLEWDDSWEHAAYSGPNETEERLRRGEDPVD
ncbi:hypothetical protein [Corynebacterium renale]|uniref:hypothetical protein n=1 Tax=Corynebacterium renale TaxID=1724 RepID=UPI000E0579D6|nr:hypothetical protein [Corynebacterium renale]STC97765.1 putative DNA-binding protein [Corynebacterium renale]STD70258.1 putative DNA-binding protein [Corynebacterium renale]